MKQNKIKLLLTLWVIIIISGCAAKSSIGIKDAWARPGLQSGNSAVYFTIGNTTNQDDTLIKASSSIANQVEIHMSMMDSSGAMMMKPQESVAIPAKSSVEFKPGGYHIMLINLPQELKGKDEFSLTLEFENAGSMTINVVVRQP